MHVNPCRMEVRSPQICKKRIRNRRGIGITSIGRDRIRYDIVHDHELRSWQGGISEMLQDLLRIFGWPVMSDEAHKEDRCVLNWLSLKEVVFCDVANSKAAPRNN